MVRKEVICMVSALMLAWAVWASAENVVITGPDSIYDCYASSTGAGNATLDRIGLREYWRPTQQYDYRAFIRVDLSSIPQGATINSASLNLKVRSIDSGYTAKYVDLFKVSSFTTSLTGSTCDGTTPWPNDVFDGVDGGYRTPVDRRLATLPVDPLYVNAYMPFSSDQLTQYIQDQVNSSEDRYVYFELSWNDSGGSKWFLIFSTRSVSDNYPYLEISYNAAGQTAAPVFTPQGYINGATPITITSATDGAKIYYTTNGTLPSTKSTLYTGPVTIDPSGLVNGVILNAIAVTDEFSPSTVTSYTYLVPPVTLESKSGRIDTTAIDGGALVMNNGQLHINGNVYKRITLKGTVKNWTGYVDSSWAGTYAYVGLLGTDYFVDRSVPSYADQTMNVFAYADNSDYGDAAHSRGLAANGGLIFWKGVEVWSCSDGFQVEDAASASTSLSQNLLSDPSQFEYEVEYDLSAMTATIRIRDVGDTAWDGQTSHTVGVRNGSGTDDWSDLVFSVQLVNSLSTDYPSDYGFDYTVQVILPDKPNVVGDANLDGAVDVGDLGILAANYGMTSGATWSQGDFNGDGKVDVGDLGILAANYGTGTQTGADFNADYAKVFGAASEENAAEDTTSSACSSLGLSLIAGLAMLGLMLVKLED